MALLDEVFFVETISEPLLLGALVGGALDFFLAIGSESPLELSESLSNSAEDGLDSVSLSGLRPFPAGLKRSWDTFIWSSSSDSSFLPEFFLPFLEVSAVKERSTMLVDCHTS